jgi:hypothetical protein
VLGDSTSLRPATAERLPHDAEIGEAWTRLKGIEPGSAGEPEEVDGPHSYVGVVAGDGSALEIAFMMHGTGPGSHLELSPAKDEVRLVCVAKRAFEPRMGRKANSPGRKPGGGKQAAKIPGWATEHVVNKNLSPLPGLLNMQYPTGGLRPRPGVCTFFIFQNHNSWWPLRGRHRGANSRSSENRFNPGKFEDRCRPEIRLSQDTVIM